MEIIADELKTYVYWPQRVGEESCANGQIPYQSQKLPGGLQIEPCIAWQPHQNLHTEFQI